MINRRRFLVYSAGGFGAALLPGWVPPVHAQDKAFRATAIAGWRKRILSILVRGRLPIIDVEATYNRRRTDIDFVLDVMKRNDIAQIVFAPVDPREASGDSSLRLYRQYPEFFIPCASSGEGPLWRDDTANFLKNARADLATGRYFMMGEHEFRHYPSPEQVRGGQTDRDVTVPIDGSFGHALFKLSADTGIAFQIHYEIEERLFAALESMLAQYPKARVIWCHLGMVRYPDRAGRYGAAYVRSLIERFPGLHFDLASPGPNSVYKPSGAHDATLYTGRQVNDTWRAVIEAHPDRFLSASDYRPPIQDRWERNYERQRDMILTHLSESVRHKVAYGNAWRLITGEDWKA